MGGGGVWGGVYKEKANTLKKFLRMFFRVYNKKASILKSILFFFVENINWES